MKKITIVLLSLSTLFITESLHGMDGNNKAWGDSKYPGASTSYKDAATSSNSSPAYRSSRTVTTSAQQPDANTSKVFGYTEGRTWGEFESSEYPPRYSDNPGRPKSQWQPKRREQVIEGESTSDIKVVARSQSPNQIKILAKESTQSVTSEVVLSPVAEQTITIDVKVLQRIALLADMLPNVLKKQTQQETAIAELQKELNKQAQAHKQQQSAVDSEHKKTLQALHEEFNRQMLSKQEELSKRVVELTEKNNALQEEHKKALELIAQNTGSVNYQLYLIACQMGLVQTIANAEQAPEEQKLETEKDN